MWGVWNGFLLGKAKKEDVPCRFCGKRDGVGHLLWECTFPSLPSPSLQHVRGLPEFASPVSLDRSRWPRCLLRHGGCLDLVVFVTVTLGLPLLGDLAFSELERRLGACPVDFFGSWTPPEYWEADEIALERSDHPNIWTDGSREEFSSIGGFDVVLVFICLLSEIAFDGLV